MYAVIDVETTGQQFGADKITEIAIIITDGKTIVAEFQTLLNPGRAIDPYVEKLTGITNAMVKSAPTFESKAAEIFDLIQGNYFVAHNVSFDFALVNNQLAAAGFHLNVSQIDTVTYARRIIQGLPSYSLGNICDALGIPHTDRHRAYGDTLATAHLFHHLLANDEGQQSLKAILNQGLDERCLPTGLSPAAILSLPNEAGMFILRTDKGEAIAIEAGKNIRKKVIEKVQQLFFDMTDKELFNSIAHIDAEVTGNEMMAKIWKYEWLMKEQIVIGRTVKNHLPSHAIILDENGMGLYQLKVVTAVQADGLTHLPFTSKTYANKAIEKLMQLHGLHNSYNQIIAEQNERLREGRIIEYNVRLKNALLSSTYRYPNMIIVDKGKEKGNYAVVWIEDGKYKGRSFVPSEQIIDKNTIAELIEHRQETADIQKAIRNHLKKTKVVKLIRY